MLYGDSPPRGVAASSTAASSGTEPLLVHFSTMMMHTAWEREDTSLSLVAPVARCRRASRHG
eukprot:64020-Chlamydomonas_euryale.AAC.1